MKLVLIWANCQSNIPDYIFSKYFPNEYNVKIYINYDYIRGKHHLPEDFKICDIFLYQNYKKKKDEEAKYDLEYIKSKILPKKCITLCFPTLHGNLLYFNYETSFNDENKYIMNEHPKLKKKIYFNIDIVSELFLKLHKENDYENKIIKEFINTDLTEEKILYYNKRSFDFLKLKILNSDIPELYDYILDNWKVKKLWYNPNHPTGFLYMKLGELIFKKLNLKVYLDVNDFNHFNSIHRDYEMPILPCVKKYYKLNFKDTCCIRGLKNVKNTETYIKEFISNLKIKLL